MLRKRQPGLLECGANLVKCTLMFVGGDEVLYRGKISVCQLFLAASDELMQSPFAVCPDFLQFQSSLPIAPAVSTIRLEKPHSLSYQLSTRTSLPSITAVSRLSMVELLAQPL